MSPLRLKARLKWILLVAGFFLLTMTLFRLAFYMRYNPGQGVFPAKAFIMGMRFDLRYASVLGIFMVLLGIAPALDPFTRKKAARFWVMLLTGLWLLTMMVYVADFFHFDYLSQRLNASVLNYLQDPAISFGMIFQSYPVLPVFLVVGIAAFVSYQLFNRSVLFYQRAISPAGRSAPMTILVLLIFAFFVFGKAGQYPLRWSDAFTVGNNFNANVALNPFQSFLSSLKFRSSGFEKEKVRKSYPFMADLLGVDKPDPDSLDFKRSFSPETESARKPNIILVIAESFSAYKTGSFGNPLRTTPYFDTLAAEGVLFERCFTPTYGTARGIWALVTGIPDVESPRTASRNPAAVDQRTIINDFREHEHLYFIGGNPSWANIQGMLSNNIERLRMYMQYDFKSPKIDVWGISDKNLFLEANSILKNESKPFFAIIQTADNHRPYTIPEEDRPFVDRKPSGADSLRSFGFESNEELFAFRYADYCFRVFMEAAKKEDYFRNTIFIFIGDHGIRGDAGKMFPRSWTENGLTSVHVPLLFYAPGKLMPSRRSGVCSQLDVLPSIAGLTGIPFSNHTMGSNLFDSVRKTPGMAFIMDHDLHQIGIVNESVYFMQNLKTRKEELVSVLQNDAGTAPRFYNRDSLRMQAEAWYETARYMLFNNKKR